MKSTLQRTRLDKIPPRQPFENAAVYWNNFPLSAIRYRLRDKGFSGRGAPDRPRRRRTGAGGSLGRRRRSRWLPFPRESSDRTAEHLDLRVVRDLENDETPLLVECGDPPEDAAARDDLVPLLQPRQHLLRLLLLLPHGRDQEEVEDDEDEDHRSEGEEASARGRGRRLEQVEHAGDHIGAFAFRFLPST